MILFIDTHNSKKFHVGALNDDRFIYVAGDDASAELIGCVDALVTHVSKQHVCDDISHYKCLCTTARCARYLCNKYEQSAHAPPEDDKGRLCRCVICLQNMRAPCGPGCSYLLRKYSRISRYSLCCARIHIDEMEAWGNTCTQRDITKIIIVKGPGSLTGLRIGSATALGIACGIELKTGMSNQILGISVFDILLAEYDAEIFFYTGTKKWIRKNREREEIAEQFDLSNMHDKLWISNNSEKLLQYAGVGLNNAHQIPYPNIIELMPKYTNLATENTDLLYPVTMIMGK